MLPGPEPTDADYESQRALGLGDYGDNIKSLAISIVSMLPPGGIEPQKGSYSFKDEDDRTVAKIIPLRDRVFVGIRVCEGPAARDYENPAGWGLGQALESKSAGVGRRRARFDGVYVRSESDLGSAYELIETFNHRFPPVLEPPTEEGNDPDGTSEA